MASALSAFSGTASLAALSQCRRSSTALLIAPSAIIINIRRAALPTASSLVGGAFCRSRIPAACCLGLRMGSMPTDRAEVMETSADDAPSSEGGAAAVEGVVAAKAAGPREKATVISVPGRDSMVITLSIAGKQYNLNRSKDEELGKCLARIQQNALKATAKKSGQRSRGRGRNKNKSRDGGASGANGGGAPKGDEEAVAQRPSSPVAPAVLEVALFDSEDPQGPPIPHDTPNEAAWERGQVLQVGADRWDILHNIPTVEQMSLPGRCIIGVPVVPSAELLFTDPEVCQWRWWRKPAGRNLLHKRQAPGEEGAGAAATAGAAAAQGGGEGWQLVEGHAERIYTPSQEDNGCLLKVDCLPARLEEGPTRTDIGNWSTAASTGAVEEGPQMSAGAKRHPLASGALTSHGDAFRVLTYNVLADQYVRFEKNRPDEKRRDLFLFCANKFLDPDYRKQLIAAEILGFHPDVICMQEVDFKLFSGYYQPYFESQGFEGLYTRKAGKIDEGCALFARKSRFKIAARRDVEMRKLFVPPLQGGMERLAPLLDASPRLQKALQKVSTIAQLAILEPVATEGIEGQEGPLVVANTHLFFHPGAGNIRTVHTAAIVEQAAGFAASWAREQQKPRRPALVFCGDLNSDLNDEEGVCGAVQLLAEGHLSSDHWEWKARCHFDWDAARGRGGENGEEDAAEGSQGIVADDADEGAAFPLGTVMDLDGDRGTTVSDGVPEITGVELRLPCRLLSADGLASDFTNYVRGYQALLDYIWLQADALSVERFIPLPTLPEVEGFCPSARWPSDHISVVADLRWLPVAAAEAPAQAAPQDGGDSPVPDPAEAPPGECIGVTPEYVLPAELCNTTKGAAPLMQGGVLAVPTDTLYGLACCANSSVGIDRIYCAKGRPKTLPLAICVADPAEVGLYGDASHLPAGILEDLLPGPTTVILQRLEAAKLSESLNPGVPTIGIRVPDSPFIRGICSRLGRAIALTSANVSGAKSSTRTDHFRELWGRCAVVFDGGEIFAPPVGSTIIDLSVPGEFAILRKGINHEHYADLMASKWRLNERQK